MPEELTEDGPLEDIPFEPWFFWASLALPRPRSLRWVFWVACALAVPLLLLLEIVTHIRLAYLAFLGGLAVGEAVVLLAEPAYIRLTPGRFDVLAYRPWRLKPIATSTYDLKQARVVMDLVHSQVRLGDGQRTLELSLDGFVRPRRFARALLLAALSSYQAGPVSMDELAG